MLLINQAYAYVNHNYVNPQDKIIEICCSWNDQLNDNILTYHINIDKKAEKGLKKIVENSLNHWAEMLSNNIRFEKEKNKKDADIQIDFKRDIGEERGGKTVTHLDKMGFIDHVQIYISKTSYGSSLDLPTIEQISKHEIGHSLGLGHSNFAKSLMYPLVDTKILKIQKCEIAAVSHINTLKLFEREDYDLPQIQLKLFEREDYDLPQISLGSKYKC
ncbi:MAG: M57 family metalloprotease [Nitrososphaeraceae archaeon]